jgi:putative heme-binding domain-containing protein
MCAMCMLVCGLATANQAFAQALPDGKGKTEFVHNCTACHRADMVTRVKKTPADWRKSVDEMASRGTDGTKQDLDNAYLYLVTFYAADSAAPPAPSAPAQSAAPPTASAPAAPNSALSPSDLDHVKQVITASLCLTCHRIEHQGAYVAPSLNGISARATPDEIRTAITSPPPTLEPAYYQVKLTTEDGTVVTGRLLHEDDQQLRVLLPSGDVVNYAKPSLQQFTVITDNPMPAYGHRLNSDDLDKLVRYLSSLPPVDDGVHK